MFKENFIDQTLKTIKKFVPRSIFIFFAPFYHWGLSMLGAIIYGFPSRTLKIIAVTGTKGKSTTVYMIAKIFEAVGEPVAAIGSLGFKIKDREWLNNLKMTMPGRLKLQKFLSQAKQAGCRFVVMEATSEGIVQKRLTAIDIDCAVFTNLHREHLESHGSFENYFKAKQKLFLKTENIHVLNLDDSHYEKFANFPARNKITYGLKWGTITTLNPASPVSGLDLQLLGDFNKYNALAALAVADAYRLDLKKAVAVLNSIKSIPGRMEILKSPKGFTVVIDYAHTPDSLELVYKNLRGLMNQATPKHHPKPKLICVLGAAGGGRDKWKRPEFGKIAAEYCDEIILTNEDPYDEDPATILDQIEKGFAAVRSTVAGGFQKILNRGEAIKIALTIASKDDIVVITGKGSETSIASSGGKKIPWSDKETVQFYLSELS